ncbi:hypothetical protein [Streptomyces sp. NPDC001774]
MACSECNITHAAADRIELWELAHKRLTGKEWPEAYPGVDPSDVLALTLFLSGEYGSPGS